MAEEKVEEKKVTNVIVETYANDMAGVIGDNENGMVKKIIEEEERHNAQYEKLSPESTKNKIFLAVGVVLVFLSFAAVSLVFLFRKEIFTVNITPQYVPIVFTDKTEFKDISGLKKEEVIQTILNEAKGAEFKDGGIEGIYLTIDKKVLGLRKFLDLMEASIDQTQSEFIGDNFLIGATDRVSNDISTESKTAPSAGRDLFILLKMRSTADVFDPMKVWESKMFSDLHGLFGVNINADTKYLLEKKFDDGIIQNKNARILHDKDGNIVIMYIFAEDDSLIITNSENAASEVMLRLASSTIKK